MTFRPIGVCALAVLALANVAAGQVATSAPPVSLETLLLRAGAYVVRFRTDFSNVVAEERYLQVVSGQNGPVIGRGPGGSNVPSGPQRRELVSDFLLVKINGTNTWMPFRDVFEVDGQPVREREARLASLFLSPNRLAFEVAQNIVIDSARYNIGELERTINNPLLGQQFLDPPNQPRFRFTLGREDTTVGTDVWMVSYEERTQPTFVQTPDLKPLFASGRVWIEAASGRVLKTEVIYQDPSVHASLITSFRADDRFHLDVPFEMIEDYTLRDRSRISGRASYGSFRRFDVTASETVASTPSQWITEPFTGLVLVEIPPGQFPMGSTSAETGSRPDERIHDVTFDAPFYLGRFEVTQDEWRKVMDTKPSRSADCGPRCPVENVSFDDVQKFLAKLNARSAIDIRFRLPTEAEWEYACRAGTVSAFSTGASITPAQANVNGKRPAPAGSFEPNPWGLGEMHGNVAEWTSDWYAPYPDGAVSDPHGPSSGDKRVFRGGSWDVGAAGARCALRASDMPIHKAGGLGFRVAADFFKP